MNTLENILGAGEAVPEDKTVEQVTQQVATEGEGQTEQTETEGQQQEGEGETGKSRMVPHEALHAEKQKVKRYTEEVSEFRKQLAESNAAWERRVAAILEAQKPKEATPPPPDFFENPQAATRHELTQAVSPEFERINKTLQAFARDAAVGRFDEAKVNEAEQAFLSAMKTGKLDQSDYQRVVNSPNRFAAAVQWHQHQLLQQEIGSDPAAYKQRLRDELKTELLAELNGGNGGGQQQQKPAPVTPSNLAGARNVGARTGPAFAGPTELADIFAR